MIQAHTAVLFLVFNRPNQTKQVFEAIKSARPERLYVAADGPRTHKAGEEEQCRQTRAIATAVDWPCKVTTLFRDDNFGCGAAVSQAISWFFQHEEEGIILEDDCLPHQDFFPFCETLLARYRDEPRIATIAGTHFLPSQLAIDHSHYVSKYFQMWGWATWRRTWAKYDYNLRGMPDAEWHELFRRVHPIPLEAGYWTAVLNTLKVEGIDTWDFQVFFSCWRAGANHVMPGRNLVSNLGYGPDATHTAFESPMANLTAHPLKIPVGEEVPIEPDPRIDNLIFYLRFLESMTKTWWAEQVLAPDQRLAEARLALAGKDSRIRKLEREINANRRQLRLAVAALADSQRILNSRGKLLRRVLVSVTTPVDSILTTVRSAIRKTQ
jgi:hypothetical protein